jgi:hypothetical protein
LTGTSTQRRTCRRRLASAGTLATKTRRGRLTSPPACAPSRPAITRLPRRDGLSTDHLAEENRLKVRAAGDGVFVQLADEAAFFQDVETGRKTTGPTRIQLDRVCVLLAAKDQLSLALTLCRSLPDRQRDAQHDGHHAQPDEQGRHRIAALAARHGRSMRISVVADALLPSTIWMVTVTVNFPSDV